jgi:hypothetical protein
MRGTAMTHTAGPWETYETVSAFYVAAGGTDLLSIPLTEKFADEDRANANLIALAPTAPHDCEVKDCPGQRNKRLLEAAEGLLEACTVANQFFMANDDFTDCGEFPIPDFIQAMRDAIQSAGVTP